MCPCPCDQTAWPLHIISCVKPNKAQHYNCGQDLRYILTSQQNLQEPNSNQVPIKGILGNLFSYLHKKKRLINIEEQHLHNIAYLVFLSVPTYT